MNIPIDASNCIINAVSNYISNDRHGNIYIYGAASGAKIVYEYLLSESITVEAFLVDSEYYVPNQQINGIPVKDLYVELSNNVGSMVIVGLGTPKNETLDRIKDSSKIVHGDFMSLCKFGSEALLDTEFVHNNIADFNKTMDLLEDDYSRIVMQKFLKAKITGEMGILKEICEKDQYFPKDIIDINKISGYVDCGAYIGDSFQSLLKLFKERTGEEYSGEAFLFEIDEKNIRRIPNDVRNRSKIYQIGLWDTRDKMIIRRDGDKTTVIDMLEVDSNNTKVELETLDNILEEEKVDFIKMDIEGAELKALQGGMRIIKEYQPTLAISVYHRRDDLIKIPQFIKECYSKYRFYLRAHMPTCVDVVLYAVPY